MPSKEKKWARERNFNKFKLSGICSSLTTMAKSKATLPDEASVMRRAAIFIQTLLDLHDSRNVESKKQYLGGAK